MNRQAQNKPAANHAPQGDGQEKTRKRKKRRNRVRTKTCAKCFTPCTTITRCKLRAAASGSTYICDICWPTYCDGNPDYVYEGTWQNGRIIDDEKQRHGDRKPASQQPKQSAPPRSKPAPDAEQPAKNPHQHQSTPSRPRFQKRGRRMLNRLVRREGGGSARRE